MRRVIKFYTTWLTTGLRISIYAQRGHSKYSVWRIVVHHLFIPADHFFYYTTK